MIDNESEPNSQGELFGEKTDTPDSPSKTAARKLTSGKIRILPSRAERVREAGKPKSETYPTKKPPMP